MSYGWELFLCGTTTSHVKSVLLFILWSTADYLLLSKALLYHSCKASTPGDRTHGNMHVVPSPDRCCGLFLEVLAGFVLETNREMMKPHHIQVESGRTHETAGAPWVWGHVWFMMSCIDFVVFSGNLCKYILFGFFHASHLLTAGTGSAPTVTLFKNK